LCLTFFGELVSAQGSHAIAPTTLTSKSPERRKTGRR